MIIFLVDDHAVFQNNETGRAAALQPVGNLAGLTLVDKSLRQGPLFFRQLADFALMRDAHRWIAPVNIAEVFKNFRPLEHLGILIDRPAFVDFRPEDRSTNTGKNNKPDQSI